MSDFITINNNMPVHTRRMLSSTVPSLSQQKEVNFPTIFCLFFLLNILCNGSLSQCVASPHITRNWWSGVASAELSNNWSGASSCQGCATPRREGGGTPRHRGLCAIIHVTVHIKTLVQCPCCGVCCRGILFQLSIFIIFNGNSLNFFPLSSIFTAWLYCNTHR